jgi:hypothetical protein
MTGCSPPATCLASRALRCATVVVRT